VANTSTRAATNAKTHIIHTSLHIGIGRQQEMVVLTGAG
jgi:hypothetical protein